MRRRQHILAVLALAAWPITSFAQTAGRKIPTIGFLISETVEGQASRIDALRSGLRERGYIEGNTLIVVTRTADGNYARLPTLAAELVRLEVDLIVTFGVKAAVAAKRATKTIPLVIPATADPVASGLVVSLARPEGNITGSAIFGLELNAKRLELLKDLFPRMTRGAFLVNPANASLEPTLEALHARSQALRVDMRVIEVRTPGEIEGAFARLADERVDAMLLQQDTLFGAHHDRIAELALKGRIPSAGNKEYAEAGGLIGYGANDAELYRRGAYFVDRILKGAKPGDLPFERPNEFELVLNMRSAKALGLQIPQSVLLSADQVIE